MSFNSYFNATIAIFIVMNLLIGMLMGAEVIGANDKIPVGVMILNVTLPVWAPLLLWVLFDLPANRKRAREFQIALPKIEERISEIVLRHRAALSKNLSLAIKRDDYGSIVSDGRYSVWQDFFASVQLHYDGNSFARDIGERILKELEAQDLARGFDPDNLPADGHDFERWVSKSLTLFGWETQVTTGSGDQGIDIIARKNGRAVGIQCKLYTGTVGNKAVQEAYSGKAHYCLDDAAVLSNAQFTPAAKKLAQTTGVYLLSHYDIPTLDRKLEIP